MRATWLPTYKNEVVGYIGPGTGLGGGFVKVGASSDNVSPITDGHIYDIMLQTERGLVMAEDVISGRAIVERCGVSAKDINDDDDLWDEWHSEVVVMGQQLVELIDVLQSGSIQKFQSKHAWSETDCRDVMGCRHFMLGGSCATQGRFGALLVRTVVTGCRIPSVISVIPDTVVAALMGLSQLYVTRTHFVKLQ